MTKKDTFQRIRALELPHQGVLAAYLCERMLPNYRYFHELTEFGDPAVLRGALDAVWEKLAVNKGTDWQRWQEKLEEITPTEQEYDVLGVFPAIAACTGLSSLLQGIEEKDGASLLDVSKISQGAVSHYLELGEFSDIEDAGMRAKAIAEHPLSLYEIDIQQAMLTFLEETSHIDKALIREVRAIARDEGMSNLGI
ncbi:YjaG family protein [Aliidiomarina indica]|uniref:YjaG family protein n=1 Tax=Aliidiomarina indica TaxID=2749147 RepID=UPI00188DEEAF|nr:YjaG family protein [Aliidiomarina indica]